jgi:hypothetical protein
LSFGETQACQDLLAKGILKVYARLEGLMMLVDDPSQVNSRKTDHEFFRQSGLQTTFVYPWNSTDSAGVLQKVSALYAWGLVTEERTALG